MMQHQHLARHDVHLGRRVARGEWRVARDHHQLVPGLRQSLEGGLGVGLEGALEDCRGEGQQGYVSG